MLFRGIDAWIQPIGAVNSLRRGKPQALEACIACELKATLYSAELDDMGWGGDVQNNY